MFFKDYEKIKYSFGNETSTTIFQNLTLYTDIIDQIKDDVSFYSTKYIQEGERPDQTSLRFYGSPIYYWTFFLLNDKLRTKGWPIDKTQLLQKVKKDYPNFVITLRRDLSQTFTINQFVTGNTSGARGKIIHRNLDNGQLVLKLDNPNTPFISTESVTILVPTTITEQLYGASDEYLAAKYYKDGSGRVDYDPVVGPGATLTEVTILDDASEQNNDLREIKVLRPEYLEPLVASYNRAVQS